MTSFEWTIIGLIIVGVVLPFWVMVALAVIVTRRKPNTVITTPGRARQYAELMREFEHAFKKTTERKLDGPTLVACIRDLKAYPEYKDASIRLLEGINVNGNGVFVDMVKTEMRAVENHLLSVDPAETDFGSREK
ncbi:MAG: hypothetical protein AAF697_06970 [Pseudomonadota bacterium]